MAPIVLESLGSVTPTLVAQRYGISTGLLFACRKQLLRAATEVAMPCEFVEASPSAARMALPAGGRVSLACGRTDMRRGFDGLAAQVQMVLRKDPHGGALFVFRRERGDLVKAIWWMGKACACSPSELERGSFVWPLPGTAASG